MRIADPGSRLQSFAPPRAFAAHLALGAFVAIAAAFGSPAEAAPAHPLLPAPGWVYSVTPWSVVDTDIDPEEAEVWLDGEMIGEADRYDGWPQKLEIPPGEHRLEFRLEGYRTLRIDIDAEPGLLYVLDRRLRPKVPAPQE